MGEVELRQPQKDAENTFMFDFLEKVYAPPPKGSRRMLWHDGLLWKWKAMMPLTAEVSEGQDAWRQPTQSEIDGLRSAFGITVHPEVKN